MEPISSRFETPWRSCDITVTNWSNMVSFWCKYNSSAYWWLKFYAKKSSKRNSCRFRCLSVGTVTWRSLGWVCIEYVWLGNHINTLRPIQNGRHFPDDISKCILLSENVLISIKISLKFVPKDPINNIPALTMAWRRPGDKPLSEPMLVSFADAYMRHSAPMS